MMQEVARVTWSSIDCDAQSSIPTFINFRIKKVIMVLEYVNPFFDLILFTYIYLKKNLAMFSQCINKKKI